MLRIKHIKVSDKESDRPWLGRLFVSFEPGDERVYLKRSRVWHPPTDVYETDSHVTVKLDLAGVSEDHIVVRLHGRQLTIYGQRDDPVGKLAYQQMEISYGEFRSEVNLPCEVDQEHVRAEYEQGFLYILLPKLKRKLRVTVVKEEPGHTA
jgi:HSP20 family molecular chaperone IbpA